MTPQTVTIRIPRKASERIQFSKELYDKNPQEWEVETRQGEPAKILTTEWNQECCVVYNTKHFGRECNANGFYYQSESPTQFDLFMRRKSDERPPEIPVIENIHQTILDAVTKPNALDMSDWHTCDTTHCRAGWVTTLAGEKGKELEKATSTLFAAMQIYKKSSTIKVSPVRFFESNKAAIADIIRCAEEEKSSNP